MDEGTCPETFRKSTTRKKMSGTSNYFFFKADRTGLQFSTLILKSSHLTKCILLFFTHLEKKKGDELVLMTADLKQKNKFHFGGAPP